MKLKKYLFKYLFSSAIGLTIFSLTLSPALAVTFDPNNIITNEEMTDASTMTLTDIEVFLRSKGGYISSHQFKDANGTMRSAAEIIYNASNNYDCEDVDLNNPADINEKKARCQPVTINPQLLLVLLQKEMSLIEETSPTSRQLDWATGYGCPDGGGCNSRWRGFGKQVNSAALQFSDYLENPNHYTYRTGNTYTVTNTGRPPSVITPQNDATAALYNYTPHVYNGNFNFFKLWLRYFTRNYGNLTLLQAKGEPGVWLIQEGKRRPFLSKGALTSRFNPNKIIQVSKADLEKYPTGDPIKFPQYSFVRSPRGTVFLLVDDTRRGFASGEALRKVGINPEEIVDASWDDINTYEEGSPITATTTFPMGALLQDKTTGGIFYVYQGTKAPLWDAVLLKTKFRNQVIIPETPEKLASYETVEPAIFSDGELLTSDKNPAVYVIDNKTKRAFTSGKIFEELGYDWGNIISIPKKILDLYPDGEALSEIYSEEDIEIVDPNATNTPAVATSTDESDLELEEEIEDILNP